MKSILTILAAGATLFFFAPSSEANPYSSCGTRSYGHSYHHGGHSYGRSSHHGSHYSYGYRGSSCRPSYSYSYRSSCRPSYSYSYRSHCRPSYSYRSYGGHGCRR